MLHQRRRRHPLEPQPQIALHRQRQGLSRWHRSRNRRSSRHLRQFSRPLSRLPPKRPRGNGCMPSNMVGSGYPTRASTRTWVTKVIRIRTCTIQPMVGVGSTRLGFSDGDRRPIGGYTGARVSVGTYIRGMGDRSTAVGTAEVATTEVATAGVATTEVATTVDSEVEEASGGAVVADADRRRCDIGSDRLTILLICAWS